MNRLDFMADIETDCAVMDGLLDLLIETNTATSLDGGHSLLRAASGYAKRLRREMEAARFETRRMAAKLALYEAER